MILLILLINAWADHAERQMIKYYRDCWEDD